MNKELILKYKKEFNHWLLTNNCLLKTKVEGNWIKVTDSTWNLAEDNLIIINDEYVEFRKALAEGKTIQYYAEDYNEWVDCVNQTSPSREFLVPPSKYRIKPEEPKFKVGDCIIVTKGAYKGQTATIVKVKDNAYNFDEYISSSLNDSSRVYGWRIETQDYLELYKPKFKVGDWVVSPDGNIERIYKLFDTHPTHAQFSEIQEHGTSDIGEWALWQPQPGELCYMGYAGGALLSKIVKIEEGIVHFETGYTCYVNKCEPFIGEIPTFVKDR